MKNEALNSVQEYAASCHVSSPSCHDGADDSTILYLIRLHRATFLLDRAIIFPVATQKLNRSIVRRCPANVPRLFQTSTSILRHISNRYYGKYAIRDDPKNNVPDNIFSKLGTQLYMRDIEECNIHYFDTNYSIKFNKFDNHCPIVSVKQVLNNTSKNWFPKAPPI
ncbi:hypothetical protein MTR_8g046320 [Medicago truncatula]|uniref:Uncharacterized protein n=1 Tax=Medicago truncatula TaxID=3880 RepID=G7L8K7_MEDTR|nr:hypothetical protein MTR_8g046320 [Medicago truncatula]